MMAAFCAGVQVVALLSMSIWGSGSAVSAATNATGLSMRSVQQLRHWLSSCTADRRGFPDFLAKTASRPHLKHIGRDYVDAVIATFTAVVRVECPAAAEPNAEVERSRLAAAAVLPLTELLAARGPFEDVPIADWMLRGGAYQAQLVYYECRVGGLMRCSRAKQATARGEEHRSCFP